MRAAVLSDIHSNRQALEAVLAAVDEARVDQIWCLGDMVGYGADPDACTALIRERSDACLVGNHDLAVLGALDISTFSENAAAAVEWTRENVSAETLEFLRELEPAGEREGVGLFHASPRDPIWEYVLSSDQAEAGFEAQEQRVGLIGHSHIALFFVRLPDSRPGYAQGAQADDGFEIELHEGEWLLNPGSVGQPRDGDPRAAWLELDTDAWTGLYHRVPYDIEGAAAAITAAGLPPMLAERLEVGR
ncbi:MAG TPA: metallophosphoesterase family protein [Solirubrobacterales bacterium]|nr:metallophosphoesterase family protein [Solirubrobacterales bacterium]